MTTEGSRYDAHAGSINRTRRSGLWRHLAQKVGYLEGVATVSVAQRVVRAVGGSAASERVADAQEGIYGPLLDWARRSPLHTDALGHSGVAYVNEEAGTDYWFGFQIGERTFGIFDTFPGDDERRAHLEGKLAAALLERAPVVLAVPPVIEQATVLASKC